MTGDATQTLSPETASTSQTPARFNRRRFLTGAGLTLAGLTVYSTEIARHELITEHRDIHIARLPDAFHGFRIAQLSDIHFEEFTEPAFLRYAVHRVNQLRPDLVLITGDFISAGPRHWTFAFEAAERCAALLRNLQCPLRYAILGNHDAQIGAEHVLAPLISNGITPLVDQYLPIERDGQRLWLSGLRDVTYGQPDLDRAVPAQLDGPLIVMCHEPDFTDTILRHPRAGRADLILSGHTHGGQVRLPFLPPLTLPPMGKKYVEGLFHFPDSKTQLYVNRGLGTVGLPVRFDCPPEITAFTLHPA
jgi:predicted MPP superfamily phosphohydrolase